MNIFITNYLKLINENNNIIKYNDFPENVEELDITKNIYHRHEIEKIVLTNHSIKSDDTPPHGFNYINIPEWKIYILIEKAIQSIFDHNFDITFDLYNNKKVRFQVLVTYKQTGESYRLILQSNATNNKKSLKIYLISIFPAIKVALTGKFSNSGKFLGNQIQLNNIYLETINQQLVDLFEIILD